MVALDRQDPARAVRDGDDAADAPDLARDRRRGAAELGEDDLVLERVLVECSSCAEAGGATVRLGSTWYCSRQRYQDVATSGRTPRTRSSPARNRSRAAVTALYRSASLTRWRLAVWLICGIYVAPRLLAQARVGALHPRERCS